LKSIVPRTRYAPNPIQIFLIDFRIQRRKRGRGKRINIWGVEVGRASKSEKIKLVVMRKMGVGESNTRTNLLI